MAIETELKYALLHEELERFRHHPLLKKYARAKPEIYQLKSAYFDTIDFQLLQSGYALRIREYQDSFSQTIKSTLSHGKGELHQRHEWHHQVPTMTPDLSVFPDESIRNKSLDLIIQFITDFQREAWHLFLGENTEIECAIDLGKVYTSQKEAPICEIEFELLKGDLEDMLNLAKEFAQTVNWQPEMESKAEKGMKLVFPR